MKKIKNSSIYIGIVISILVIIIDYVFGNIIFNKINDKNNNFVNLEEEYNEVENGVNAYVTHNGIGNFILMKLSSDDVGNIYALYSPSIGTSYLLYISEEEFYRIEREEEIDKLKGTVRNIDDTLMYDILNYDRYVEYKIKDKEEFSDIFENDIYLDTVNVDYIDDTLFGFFAWLFLIVGIVGVIGSLILLIINNRIKIKEFIKKHTISKIIFIISFIPYILVIVISIISMFTGVDWFFSTYHGIDVFLLSMFLLFLIGWPVLLIVFIYQIIYIIIRIVKKKKIK